MFKKEKSLKTSLQKIENFIPAALDSHQIPSSPGIYKFFASGELIYIGKAKDLKKRVSSYFRKSILDRKTNQIKFLTDRIEIFSTQTEAQALIVEQSLIKENLPKFNILLRDDKSYPYIHFSSSDSFPAIGLKRVKNHASPDCFGPYVSVKTVKETLKDIQKIFKLRNCSNSTFRNRSRPCIEHQMHRCSAPCVGLIQQHDYCEDVSSAKDYLAASNSKFRERMNLKMKTLAREEEFERANEIKKRIAALDMLSLEKYNHELRSVDFFSFVYAFGKTGVCILSIRAGKIRGTKSFYFNEDFSNQSNELLSRLLFFYYQNSFLIPSKIFITCKVDSLHLIKQAMNLQFNQKIHISSVIPKFARQSAELALLNARQIIENKIKPSEKFIHSMSNLASYIGINKIELEIEGYDISHHSGKYGVGSCVKFTKDGANKKEYKLFNIPANLGGNDIGSLENVLTRRLAKIAHAPLPDIILIDGGHAQLNIALKVFHEHDDKNPMILSIVKGSKRVRATETILSKTGVIEMPVNSPGFVMLQKIRDESHRFAILHNRNKKNKKMRYSILDKVIGLGPIKKKNLLKEFHSLRLMKNASEEDLRKVTGISITIAQNIKIALQDL